MEARNESLEIVDQFDCWVGPAKLNAQIFLPEAPEAMVLVAYTGPMEGSESYVCELSRQFRREGFGTVVVDCMPDGHKYDDIGTPLRRYVPRLLRNRIAGVLGRLRGHEEYGAYRTAALGLGPCAAPVLGAVETFDGGLDAAVTIGGRPAQSTELVESIPAPTLVLGEYATLEEDAALERRMGEIFTGGHSQVRLLSAEPPFADGATVARTIALASNWFLDHLKRDTAPTPDLPELNDPTASPDYGLPPMPSLMPGTARTPTVRA